MGPRFSTKIRSKIGYNFKFSMLRIWWSILTRISQVTFEIFLMVNSFMGGYASKIHVRKLQILILCFKSTLSTLNAYFLDQFLPLLSGMGEYFQAVRSFPLLEYYFFLLWRHFPVRQGSEVSYFVFLLLHRDQSQNEGNREEKDCLLVAG